MVLPRAKRAQLLNPLTSRACFRIVLSHFRQGAGMDRVRACSWTRSGIDLTLRDRSLGITIRRRLVVAAKRSVGVSDGVGGGRSARDLQSLAGRTEGLKGRGCGEVLEVFYVGMFHSSYTANMHDSTQPYTRSPDAEPGVPNTVSVLISGFKVSPSAFPTRLPACDAGPRAFSIPPPPPPPPPCVLGCRVCQLNHS